MVLVALNPDAYISDIGSGFIWPPRVLPCRNESPPGRDRNATVNDQMNRIGDNLEITKGAENDSRRRCCFYWRKQPEAREDGKSSVSFIRPMWRIRSVRESGSWMEWHYLHWTCRRKWRRRLGQFLRTAFGNYQSKLPAARPIAFAEIMHHTLISAKDLHILPGDMSPCF